MAKQQVENGEASVGVGAVPSFDKRALGAVPLRSFQDAARPELERPLRVAGPATSTETRTGRPRWWRDQLRRRMLLAADLLAALAIGLATTASAGVSLWAL